jgi:hypothetical protein
MQVKIADIRTDGGTQPRAEINLGKADEYAEDMEAGYKFPPVTLFYDGSVYWLADGFHRLRAATKLQWQEIEADVKQGTQRDAILFSVGANATHGLRRTNEDKRRAVTRLLSDTEWTQWSDSEISRRCMVSQPFVSKIRASLITVISENPKIKRMYKDKHGKTRKMKTKNIGQSVKKAEYVHEKAPAPIKEAVTDGYLTTNHAFELTLELEAFPIEYRERVATRVRNSAERTRILNDLYKSAGSVESNGTFFEILETGGFAHGDNLELWCDFEEDDTRDILRGLANLSEHHKRQAREERKAEEERAATIAEFLPHIEEKPSYKIGDMLHIGNHILLCADNSSEQARQLIASLGKIDLIFCDPPYNANAAAYDDGSFIWEQDFLAEMASIVAVTCGISSIQSFMKRTNMPYKWSVSAHIANGMTRGALGFGNWIYTALFSEQDSIHKNRQDIGEVTITGKQHDAGEKKQKPAQYLSWLFQLLTSRDAWVVDAFGGSGNSVIVAHELGRKCLTIERDVDTFNQMVANVSAHIEDELELAA